MSLEKKEEGKEEKVEDISDGETEVTITTIKSSRKQNLKIRFQIASVIDKLANYLNHSEKTIKESGDRTFWNGLVEGFIQVAIGEEIVSDDFSLNYHDSRDQATLKDGYYSSNISSLYDYIPEDKEEEFLRLAQEVGLI
jgi:hypothetical protein